MAPAPCRRQAKVGSVHPSLLHQLDVVNGVCLDLDIASLPVPLHTVSVVQWLAPVRSADPDTEPGTELEVSG